jgi:NitT/TauT family transport system substrate-binding protein
MRRFVLLLVGVLLIAAIAIGIWLRAREPKSSTMQVCFNTWVGYGPLYIAREKKFFAKRGLNVELHVIEGTGERRSALIAGRMDGAGSTIDDMVVTAAQGAPVRMVVALDQSDGADGILADASVRSVQDLRGQSIAVQPGFVNHFFLLYVLKQAGLTQNDVHLVPMEPDKAGAAFVNGSVKVAVTWEPYLSQVQGSRQGGHVLVTSHNYPGVIADNLLFRDDVVHRRRGEVNAFIDAWYEAVDYMRTNPDDANRIIGDAFKIAPAEVASMLRGVHLMSKSDNVQFFNPGSSPNAYSMTDLAARLWQEQGFVKSPVDPHKIIDPSFVTGR